jgi:hypothetical protein
VLDNGIRLMDSSLILAYFEGLASPAQAATGRSTGAGKRSANVGFILAAGEKAVQNVYEHNCARRKSSIIRG